MKTQNGALQREATLVIEVVFGAFSVLLTHHLRWHFSLIFPPSSSYTSFSLIHVWVLRKVQVLSQTVLGCLLTDSHKSHATLEQFLYVFEPQLPYLQSQNKFSSWRTC